MQFAIEFQRVETFRQLDPQHEAALWAAGARARREVASHPVDHHVAITLVLRAHPPQVRFEVAAFKKFGDGYLGLRRGRTGADVFHVQHPFQIAAGRDPADAQARRQGLGKRTAQQDATVLVEGLDRARARIGVGQFAIHIVLDDRHVKPLRKHQQRAFARLRHDVAQRVVAVGGQLYDLDRPLFQGQFQRFEADAGQWIGGDFQGLHAQALEGLHRAVKARRVHRHNVSRFADRPNAGGQRFVATGGHYQVAGTQLAAGI
ncbi:hypothetical protein D9M73_140010 [compost metagenome]